MLMKSSEYVNSWNLSLSVQRGRHHAVDSSDLAFQLAMQYGLREAVLQVMMMMMMMMMIMIMIIMSGYDDHYNVFVSLKLFMVVVVMMMLTGEAPDLGARDEAGGDLPRGLPRFYHWTSQQARRHHRFHAAKRAAAPAGVAGATVLGSSAVRTAAGAA